MFDFNKPFFIRTGTKHFNKVLIYLFSVGYVFGDDRIRNIEGMRERFGTLCWNYITFGRHDCKIQLGACNGRGFMILADEQIIYLYKLGVTDFDEGFEKFKKSLKDNHNL